MTVLTRIIAFFTALFQLFCLKTGLRQISVNQVRKEGTAMQLVNDSESNLCDSITYAYNLKNAVQASYTNPERTAYLMSNSEVQLTHNLTGTDKSATLTDINGNVYIENSFKTFYIDALGVKHKFENSIDNARINTLRLGLYYYECHVRDLQAGNYYADKAYHVYGDRLFAQYTVLANTPTTDLGGFGSEIQINKKSVKAIEIKDKNGVHTNLDGIDAQSVEYVAFDIDKVGVVGFIIPSDGSTQKVEITQTRKAYTVEQYASYEKGTGINDYKEEGGYSLNNVSFGFRIYTDSAHSFNGIQNAAHEERTPLQNITVTGTNANAVMLGYEALRGTYTLTMDGTSFQYAYDRPNLQFYADIKITADTSRNIIIRANGNSGCLEAGALLDENKNLLPIDVQVCKNFCGDGGEDIYSYKDYQYGDAFVPLSLKQGNTYQLKLLHLYQNWGNTPLKQLSSIEYFVSYYHLSTGTTESNCIAPYFVFEKDGWTLPDFRTGSGKVWATQPQYNSEGILKFMTHTSDYISKSFLSEYSGAYIASTGLTYSDITDYYVDDEGKFTYSTRHVEMPQTDENRTYYTLEINFIEDVTYLNFKENFNLFYFDSRFVNFKNADYTDANGTLLSVPVNTTNKTVYYSLSKQTPVWGYYGVTDDKLSQVDAGFGCNFAFLIKDYDITVNGEKQDVGFVFKDTSTKELTSGALTLDWQTVFFKKGDSIKINLILLPWGTGKETDDETVAKVLNDSVIHPISVNSTVGTVENDSILPIVNSENGKAEFTVTGGQNNIAVTVKGLTSYKAPFVQIKTDEGKKTLTLASELGYDGYWMRAEQDGTYSFSFVINKQNVDDSVTLYVTDNPVKE